MKKHLQVFTILFLFLSSMMAMQVHAQDVRITGKVTDATDGSSLPGVNVLIKNTTTGTSTDIDGKFSLNAKVGSTLEFSLIGYTTQTLVVGNQRTLAISMKPSITGLNEVVIIGYGQVKKGDATGSINTLSAKDFNRGAITSPQELLMGKSAGVVITSSSGAPGAGATIRIRGGSSLNASNDPLIIIDGVPIDNTNPSGSSNILSFINPNDIESFTVLKDASATAIYGSRASNGVIIITTKKSKAGSTMKITYNGSSSIASASKFIDVYSAEDMKRIAQEHVDLFGTESHNKLGNYNTDWQNEIYRIAVSHDHNISIGGAYKILPYRVSIGYTDQQGVLKNTDMQRVTGTLNLDPSFLNNDLKVSIGAKGMHTNNNFGNTDAIGSAINMDPTQPVKDGNVNSDDYFQWSNYGANLGTANPVEQLLANDNKSTVNRGIGNIQFDYKIPYIPNLRANLNLATDYTETKGHNNYPTTAPSVITTPLWGRLTNYSSKNYNNLLDFYLNYTKNLDKIFSKIDLTGGYSWQHFEWEGDNYRRGYQDSIHPYQKTDSTSYKKKLQLISFFGRMNYTFMNRYLLTFTVRDDGSSRFAKKHKWGVFPSVALAWKINEEPFIKSIKAISNLKLRLGWGITGQQDIGDNYYPYMAKYQTSSEGSYYYIDGKFIPTLRPDAYDKNIKWEETTTQNIGLDFGLLNDRITGSVDLYKRVTDDLLNQVTIATGSNFSNTLLTNVGSLENKGVEVTLNFIPISQKDMSLNVGFNFTYNKNEVTKLLLSDDSTYIGILYGDGMTGVKQVTRVGSAAKSFFVNKQIYDIYGNPIEGLYYDLSGKGGTISGNNADKYILHHPAPDYVLGFSVNFNYKNFDISTSARGSIGNYVYNQVAAGSSYDQMYQIGYWKNFTTQLNDTKFVSRQFTSDYFVENASFFKVDNISAGYKFNKIYNNITARVSFTVQNVLTITKYKGLDPEVDGGIDNNFYPRVRTYMLGVNLSF